MEDSFDGTTVPFKSLLIANRGECALRIFRTCIKLGIAPVVVYTEEDVDSLHVLAASHEASSGAYKISDYCSIPDILAVSLECEVKAIHPGYGFLSENPDFARAVEDAGVIWIGPKVAHIECFGRKDEARRICEEVGVPLTKGSSVLRSVEDAVQWVEKVGGLPVILKPVGGGGGIGMRIVQSEEELRDVSKFKKAQDLARKNFGCGDLYLEKYIEKCRHIEVQIFGSSTGGVVDLAERECSVQRRCQKVMEECPSPGLQGHVAIREEILSAALKLTEYVGYTSAGTVEFMLDDSKEEPSFYFLEVNTRLQVEHGVTEMVFPGLDLIEWMIREAASTFHLPSERAKLSRTPVGHAVQVRVYAEDVLHNFRGCSGIVQEMRLYSHEKGEAMEDYHKEVGESICGDLISPHQRFETAYYRGVSIATRFDPLIAKVLQWGATRDLCLNRLHTALVKSSIKGVTSNLELLTQFVDSDVCKQGFTYTRQTLPTFINNEYRPCFLEVVSGGISTTVQDYPGREAQGMWRIGIPPSGAMDSLACRLSNVLVGNAETDGVLEFLSARGPSLKFWRDSVVAVCGPEMEIVLKQGEELVVEGVPTFTAFQVKKGDMLNILKPIKKIGNGSRGYIAVRGGINVPLYLGSRSTFLKGQFGGYQGRELRAGDMLPLGTTITSQKAIYDVPLNLLPKYSDTYEIGVLVGPRANPDFLTDEDLQKLVSPTQWTVHHMSNRLGIRLEGGPSGDPATCESEGKRFPQWARPHGGEGGNHPSNIHDEEYAVGTINFTGDMPIIITQDGPSLGGFVCPITVVQSEMWKVGQLKAGDKVSFKLLTLEEAIAGKLMQDLLIKSVQHHVGHDFSESFSYMVQKHPSVVSAKENYSINKKLGAVLYTKTADKSHPGITIRRQGDRYILVEYGEMVLDLSLRVRIHLLEEHLLKPEIKPPGLHETAPGVRSLQLRYDPLALPLAQLIALVQFADQQISTMQETKIKSRVFYLPMNFDSPGCKEAMVKYSRTFREDAPYLSYGTNQGFTYSNVPYIARANGLKGLKEMDDANEEEEETQMHHMKVGEKKFTDEEAVSQCIFRASYLVLGLGDVYLGACCAVPVDPRDRLITTKMNPARTWTEEGTVGLGGSYMCIYPMDSPGGYQLVGRTIQVWNTWGKGCSSTGSQSSREPIFTTTRPWFLNMFDQIRFYPVSTEELNHLRAQFKVGSWTPRQELEEFDLKKHKQFLKEYNTEIMAHRKQQEAAMKAMCKEDEMSLQRIIAEKVVKDSRTDHSGSHMGSPQQLEALLLSGLLVKVESDVTASVWQPLHAKVGDLVTKDSTLIMLEAMKMEIAIVAPCDGEIVWINPTCTEAGNMVHQADVLVLLKNTSGLAKSSKDLVRIPFASAIMARNSSSDSLQWSGTKHSFVSTR